MTTHHQEARQPDRPPHPRGHRAARHRARRDPPGHPRRPRRDATRRTSARSSPCSAASSSARAPCSSAPRCRRCGCSAPSACRSPRSSRTWRSATTSCTASGTGCATRRSTPPPGSGTSATPAEQWKHSHNEIHHTYTNIVGKDNDLGYGIMRVDEDQRWHPMYLAQPFWNFINACFFEYGIAAYDLELGRNLRIPKEKRPPEFRANLKKVLRQDPQAGHQGLRRQPGAGAPVRRLPADPGRQLHRQRGPQPLDATR